MTGQRSLSRLEMGDRAGGSRDQPSGGRLGSDRSAIGLDITAAAMA